MGQAGARSGPALSLVDDGRAGWWPVQTGLVSFCFEVPEGERASLIYAVTDFNDFELEPVIFSETGS